MAIAYPALGPAAVQFRLLSDWECKSARCANLILYTLKCQEMRVRTLRVLEAKVMVMVNMMSRCLDLIARLLCMCMHYINTEQLVLCNIRGKLSLACILCVGACVGESARWCAGFACGVRFVYVFARGCARAQARHTKPCMPWSRRAGQIYPPTYRPTMPPS